MNNIQRLFRDIKYIEIEIQMEGVYQYLYEDDLLILTLYPGQKMKIRYGHPKDLTYLGVI
jgi:hypothetical protein